MMNAQQLKEAAELQENLGYIDDALSDLEKHREDDVYINALDGTGDRSFIFGNEPVRFPTDRLKSLLQVLRYEHVAKLQALGVEL